MILYAIYQRTTERWDINEINKINDVFYQSFENISIEEMDKLWKHDVDVAAGRHIWSTMID